MADFKPLSSENLKRIKDNIESAYIANRKNCERYNSFRRYLFETTIDDNKRAALAATGKPQVEFNILDAYNNRQLSEFSMNEPSVVVSARNNKATPSGMIQIVNGHLMQVLSEADKDAFSDNTYDNMLSGGFSVAKAYPDYENEMSLIQVLKVRECEDPTMCGFDPLASTPSKRDGKFSFELFPMDIDYISKLIPGLDIDSLSFSKSIEGFSWSYMSDRMEKFLLFCEYYEKKKKRVQIVQTADDRTMLFKTYERMLSTWDKYAQPPVILKKRWTVIDTICEYQLIEDRILKYRMTDWTYLPHVFFGRRRKLKSSENGGATYDITIPYTYPAKGVQDLKNYAGQTLANSLKNMIQHKFIVKKEALPQDQKYLDAFNNIQQASTVVVQAYSENNPDKPIPDPIREIALVPAPPEVIQAFTSSDPTTQVILGSFASNLGQNDADLSGKAVIESQNVNNAAALPMQLAYMQGLTQVCNILVDLMPKYIIEKRNLPVIGKDGKTEYVRVNFEDSVQLKYDAHALEVNVEAGVSFQVQKTQALQQIISLMAISKEFNDFMNSEVGLPILLKNLTIYGSDELQEAVPRWMQMKQQLQLQQMQQQQQILQQSPQYKAAEAATMRAQADLMKVQIDTEQKAAETEIDIAKLGLEQQRVDNETLLAEQKVEETVIQAAITRERANAEIVSHALDAASKIADHHRKHDREDTKLVHEIINGERESEVQNKSE